MAFSKAITEVMTVAGLLSRRQLARRCLAGAFTSWVLSALIQVLGGSLPGRLIAIGFNGQGLCGVCTWPAAESRAPGIAFPRSAFRLMSGGPVALALVHPQALPIRK